MSSRIPGFRHLDVGERRRAVAEQAGTDLATLDGLGADAFGTEQAAAMIENAIGVFPVPVGVATNVVVDGREVLVPMATEEASVVAAASNGARMTRALGGFTTSATAPVMQVQIQLVDVPDPRAARLRLLEHADELVALADEQDPRLVQVGGGVRGLQVRLVDGAHQTYVVLHLAVDVRDAMGANAVNTMAEALAGRVAQIGGGRVVLRILTNLADQRLVRARAVLRAEDVGGEQVVEDMLHGYELARVDPYRAATHNKGIMNGISAVVLATGNDTRAVEAGAHAYAAVAHPPYGSLSTYERDGDGHLVATLEVPMPVGLVGGATRVHPSARAALSVLGVSSAAELGAIITAVGLAQNIAAVRALAADGIQRGHMSLHAKNIAASAGATGDEVAAVVDRLVAEGAFRQDRAEEILADLRAGSTG
ncbi:MULTISPECIES: hydroxymethylglutaryl-CoA reductase, degradative [unclassified Serinicoccus]|uniref:hydroxymethylglutaryl-CoA reductase, degradative n=1 Tax=unclassified Serinicoccus TaxID=2643101 RepID=UPI003854FD72